MQGCNKMIDLAHKKLYPSKSTKQIFGKFTVKNKNYFLSLIKIQKLWQL